MTFTILVNISALQCYPRLPKFLSSENFRLCSSIIMCILCPLYVFAVISFFSLSLQFVCSDAELV